MSHEHLPQTQMALVPQPFPSTNSNGSRPSVPSFNSEHMALTLQIPLYNFNMGARHNHCHTVDRSTKFMLPSPEHQVTGFGCMTHYIRF